MRIFIAFRLSADAAAKCADVRNRSAPKLHQLSPVLTENLHVTLKFLGQVPRDGLASLEACIREAGKKHRPFALELDIMRRLPQSGEARVVYLGSRQPNPAFSALVEDIETFCLALGYPSSTFPPLPHVTIFRVRKRSFQIPNDFDRELAPAIVEHCDRIAICRSDSGRGGPVYTTLFEAPLTE